jgi:hypothetical protein
MEEQIAGRQVQISEAFYEMMCLAERLGVKDMHRMGRCWEFKVDDDWWFAVNGKPLAIKCSKGQEINPYHMYVEWKGFPAGLCNVRSGTFAAGELVNEKAFCEALRSRP